MSYFTPAPCYLPNVYITWSPCFLRLFPCPLASEAGEYEAETLVSPPGAATSESAGGGGGSLRICKVRDDLSNSISNCETSLCKSNILLSYPERIIKSNRLYVVFVLPILRGWQMETLCWTMKWSNNPGNFLTYKEAVSHIWPCTPSLPNILYF